MFAYHCISVQSQTIRKDATSKPARNLKRKKPIYAESSSDDDTPLALSPAKAHKPNGRAKKNSDTAESDSSTAHDASNGRRQNGKSIKPPPKKKVKEDGSSDEDMPLAPQKRVSTKKRKLKEDSDSDPETSPAKPVTKGRRKKAKEEEEEESLQDGASKKARKRAGTAKKEEAERSTSQKGKKAAKEEEKEDVFRWWDHDSDMMGDGSMKWSTLEHSGVYFPPPYEPLPSNVKMKYNGISSIFLYYRRSLNNALSGKVVDLPPESEEVAGFYAALLETDHAKDATFNKNFFDDFKGVLNNHPPVSPPKSYLRLGTQISHPAQ